MNNLILVREMPISLPFLSISKLGQKSVST